MSAGRRVWLRCLVLVALVVVLVEAAATQNRKSTSLLIDDNSRNISEVNRARRRLTMELPDLLSRRLASSNNKAKVSSSSVKGVASSNGATEGKSLQSNGKVSTSFVASASGDDDRVPAAASNQEKSQTGSLVPISQEDAVSVSSGPPETEQQLTAFDHAQMVANSQATTVEPATIGVGSSNPAAESSASGSSDQTTGRKQNNPKNKVSAAPISGDTTATSPHDTQSELSSSQSISTTSTSSGSTAGESSPGKSNGNGNGNVNANKATSTSSGSTAGESSPGKSNGNGNDKSDGTGTDTENPDETFKAPPSSGALTPPSSAAPGTRADGEAQALDVKETATVELDTNHLRGVPASDDTPVSASLQPVVTSLEVKSANTVPSRTTASNEEAPSKSESTPGGETQKSASKKGEGSITNKVVPGFNTGSTSSKANASSPVSSKSTPSTATANDTKDPDKDAGTGKQATRAEALSVVTMDTATEDAKEYVRGDPTFDGVGDEAGSSIFAEGGDGSSPLVIGGRKRGWQAEAQSGLYAASSSFHNGVRFCVCAAALVSVILLVVFHFEALNDGLTRHLRAGSMWAPNTWEFVLYVQYIQQLAAISALTLLKTPYILWDFTDLLSWTNFLVYRAQDDSPVSGRRLTTLILGGLVGYGDRIGTNEMDLMYQTCAGCACVVGFFLGIVLGAGLYNKWRERQGRSGSRSVVWRCLGLVVLVWFFSLLPLTMAVSFEVSMEFKAQMLELWPLVTAFLVLFVGICGVLVAAARTIFHGSERKLLKLRFQAVWGVFYSDCTYGGRLFFLLAVAQQICMGLCMGILDDSLLVLVLLAALHAVFLVAVILAKPFRDGSSLGKHATSAVTALKLGNVALAFAFLPSSTLSVFGLLGVANAVIGLNALVIVVWCLRLLLIFGKLAVASARHEVERRAPQDEDVAIEASPSTSLSYELVSKPQ